MMRKKTTNIKPFDMARCVKEIEHAAAVIEAEISMLRSVYESPECPTFSLCVLYVSPRNSTLCAHVGATAPTLGLVERDLPDLLERCARKNNQIKMIPAVKTGAEDNLPLGA